MVRDALEVFPHASLANHVLVCVRKHPLLPTAPVLGVGVTAPQLSVAVAVPKAASIVAADGLHPRSALFAVVPVAYVHKQEHGQRVMHAEIPQAHPVPSTGHLM